METRPPLRILVVDDHDLVRAGVTAAASELSSNAEVFSAASIAGAVEIIERHRDIDLVLLDLVLPDAIGFSGLEAVLHASPDVPIILLTADARRETMEQAFLMGASGYIPKSSNMQIIVNALRIILAGGRYLPGELLDGRPAETPRAGSYVAPAGTEGEAGGEGTEPCDPSAHEAFDGSADFTTYGLTARQRAVAALLRKGMSNKEICRELDLSVSTVKTHIASILRALRTSSRAKAAAILNTDNNRFRKT